MKKPASFTFALLLCLSLLPMPALAADGTTDFANGETRFRASCSEDNYLHCSI